MASTAVTLLCYCDGNMLHNVDGVDYTGGRQFVLRAGIGISLAELKGMMYEVIRWDSNTTDIVIIWRMLVSQDPMRYIPVEISFPVTLRSMLEVALESRGTCIELYVNGVDVSVRSQIQTSQFQSKTSSPSRSTSAPIRNVKVNVPLTDGIMPNERSMFSGAFANKDSDVCDNDADACTNTVEAEPINVDGPAVAQAAVSPSQHKSRGSLSPLAISPSFPLSSTSNPQTITIPSNPTPFKSFKNSPKPQQIFQNHPSNHPHPLNSTNSSKSTSNHPEPKNSQELSVAGKRARDASSLEGKGKASSSRPRRGNDGFLYLPDCSIPFASDDQIAKYKILGKRKIVPTRWMCAQTVRKLGLYGDILEMFRRIGIENIVNTGCHTYKDLTLEFLSSLSTENLSGQHCAEGRISFRIRGQDQTMNLHDFSKAYGLRPGGERRHHKGFSGDAMWRKITGLSSCNYDPRAAKASLIMNPSLRIIQRVLAKTIFARGDSDGVCRKDELYFIWAMLSGGQNIDVGTFVAQQLQSVAKKDSGDISIGGLITPLAHCCGFTPGEDDKVQGLERLEVESLVSMKILGRQNEVLYYMYQNQMIFPLPNPERTTLSREENLRIQTSSSAQEEDDKGQGGEDIEMDEGDGGTRTSRGGPSSSQPDFNTTSLGDRVSSLESAILQQREWMIEMRQCLQHMEHMLSLMHGWHLDQGHYRDDGSR